MAKERRRRKKRQESLVSKILLVTFTVMFVLSLGIYMNERIFRFEFIPTSAEIISALEGDKVVTTADGEVSVHFIDVGQGDCALIVAGNKRVLIDSGEAIYSSRVINYIRKLGLRRIDYVIATHPHEDHIGGIADILEEFAVDKIIMPEIPDELIPMSKEFENMLSVIEKKGISAEYSRIGSRIILENGAEIEILAPLHNDYSSLNNFSIVCRLIHGKRSFLFTGDIERAAENDIVNSGEFIRSDVIKIPHHGGTSSSTPAFIESVSPEYAVISVGKGNSYGHPKTEVLERLWNIGCEVLTTMDRGNIVFVSDGEAFKIYSDHGTGDFSEEDAA